MNYTYLIDKTLVNKFFAMKIWTHEWLKYDINTLLTLVLLSWSNNTFKISKLYSLRKLKITKWITYEWRLQSNRNKNKIKNNNPAELEFRVYLAVRWKFQSRSVSRFTKALICCAHQITRNNRAEGAQRSTAVAVFRILNRISYCWWWAYIFFFSSLFSWGDLNKIRDNKRHVYSMQQQRIEK